jgi:hypothetical protein
MVTASAGLSTLRLAAATAPVIPFLAVNKPATPLMLHQRYISISTVRVADRVWR